MKNSNKKRRLEDDYTADGFCQMKCERRVIMMSNGPVIVCEGCKRIVIDNRVENESRKSNNSN